MTVNIFRSSVDKSDESEIAYIMKGYPRLSETFIINEIYLLERAGLHLNIFSEKKPIATIHHDTVDKIKSPVIYLPCVSSLSQSYFLKWLWMNLPKYIGCHLRLLRLRPRAYLHTLFEVMKMSVRYRLSFFSLPRKVFAKDFLLAGYIALKVIESGRIRHLHGHFCHGSTTMTMFASRLSGIPFSFTAHAKDIYLKKLNPGDLLQRKMETAKFAVTCTDANKRYLNDLCPQVKSVCTIYHGLDSAAFTPGRRKESKVERPIVLSVGRFVEKKGFVHLVKASRVLKDRGYTFQCRIVGEADEQSSRVKRLVQELHLGDTVELSDGVTQEELKQIYNTCNLFVLPCQIMANGDRDGIPNVLVEAMAMELPVISTTISGIPELIGHRVDGLLVPPQDVPALADAIEEYLRDPKLRLKMGKAGRKKVCRVFDSKKSIMTLKSLFVSSLVNN